MNNVSKKNIWYCHHYAGSPKQGMSYRPFYITKALNQLGHNGYIIQASFHHLLRKIPLPQKKAICFHNEESVPVVCVKTRYYRGSGLGRLLNSLDYALGIKKYYQHIIDKTGKPDVIIVSSAHPFHFKFLYQLSRKLNAKLIFEVRDLWPLSLQELMGLNKWHPISIWLNHIEKQAYKNADYVVSLLDKALPYMQSRGLSPERFIHIPNGVSVSSSDDIESSLNLKLKQEIERIRRKKHFLLGYAGAMGKPNALEALIKALKLLQANRIKLHCILVGDGALKQELKDKAALFKLNNVTFVDSIPKAEVMVFLKHMDALYLGWNNTSLYRYGVSPNKLFDYMLAQKPIVESGGATFSIIDEAECGIRCEAENPKAISGAFEKMAQLTDEQRKQMGLKAYHMVTENFDYQKLARDYQSIFT